MPVENKGNLITRRAFADTDRMAVLRRIVNKAMSTAYQMTEEVGEYGSGTPSPLHMVCESVRELFEIERTERREVSAAQEMAEYPMTFLRQLRGDVAAKGDSTCKMNCLLKSASDANYLLKGRTLDALTPGELKEYRQRLMDAATIAQELCVMADARIVAAEDKYPGAPFQRDRALKSA